ncbi:hypothetical protein GC177_07760 [bacterium]|nr:hypothetical protein [bacterium]
MSQATPYPHLTAYAQQARNERITFRDTLFPEELKEGKDGDEKITFDGSDIITYLRSVDRLLETSAQTATGNILNAIRFDQHVRNVVNNQRSQIQSQPDQLEQIEFLDRVLSDLQNLEQRFNEAAGASV